MWVFSIALVSSGVNWLVNIYGNGLRDPRYLDGWVLAAGMAAQLYFHVARKRGRLSPVSALWWRQVHIFVGYLLVAAFLLHSDFSLPDTAFEWALWVGFVAVTLSGIFGTYLAWSLKTRRRIDDGLSYDRIPVRRAELAQALDDVMAATRATESPLGLPTPPYDDWIAVLYAERLQAYFDGQQNVMAHLIGSQRPVKSLTDEIDKLSRYVDRQSQERLSAVKALVVEKDRLDFARVHLGLTRAWLFVHVPVTYGLIVLVVLHILTVYSYSSGAL